MKFTIASDLPEANELPARLRLVSKARMSEGQALGASEALLALPFISKASVSSVTRSIVICFEGESRGQVLKAVASLDITELNVEKANDYRLEFRSRLYWKIIVHFGKKYLLPSWLRIPLNIWNAGGYARRALKSILNGKIGVEVLDGTAITASIFMRNWDAASTLMSLLSISELLEDYTRARARKELADSLALNIDSVWVLRGGLEKLIPLIELAAGDTVIVRTGTVIPADGTVLSEEATVNQSSLTGESIAVFKKPGDSVFAGTVVEEGQIAFEARSIADESRVAQIVKLIEESESLKADIQGKAERLADSIVPLNFALAAMSYLIGGASAALSALLVDYSCAIKLSTPIAVLSAMREASSLGLIIKGGKFLEAAALADTVVFDKTGTLTSDCPEVSYVGAFDGRNPDEILRTAACLEEHFPHSLARAVIRKALSEGLRHDEEHAEVKYIAAHGIATAYSGKRVIIGSRHFVEDDENVEITLEQSEEIEKMSEGSSVLYLAEECKLIGFLCIWDSPRPEAFEAVSMLKSLGIKRIIMLTGDGEHAARSNAEKLGIDEYKAQMLPEGKRAYIESLKEAGYKPLMVGDGINDSPALAAAYVSVSMRGSSDLAAETADISMLTGDLRALASLRLLGQKLLLRIQGNYRKIIGINSSLLALGLIGILPAQTLSLAHNATTTIVSAASMRKLLS